MTPPAFRTVHASIPSLTTNFNASESKLGVPQNEGMEPVDEPISLESSKSQSGNDKLLGGEWRQINRRGNIQGIQLYTGHGQNFGGNLSSGSYRPGFTVGGTLGMLGNSQRYPAGHKILAMSLNIDTHHVKDGIWSIGFAPSLRLDFLTFNIDAGVKLATLSGGESSGVGLTSFGRVGFVADLLNIEGGVLAHSDHPKVSAGQGYSMFNFNLAWLWGALTL